MFQLIRWAFNLSEKRRHFPHLAGILWLGLLLGCFYWFMGVIHTPGVQGKTQAIWPADSLIVPRPNQANLVVAFHPRCPCSQATWDAVEKILALHPGGLHVHCLFYEPKTAGPDWVHGSLWNRTHRLESATIVRDREGQEATKFGIATSGHVVIYTPGNKILFSGGITGGPDCSNDPFIRNRLIQCILENHPAEIEMPVFGCSLGNSDQSTDRNSLKIEELR